MTTTDRPVVIFVSDPLCSWCWGTAGAFDAARAALEHAVEFDLLLGGINVDSVREVGEYGRFRLARLWAEVAVVTGQSLAAAPCAEPFVYNSARLCAVLEAARARSGQPPFALLHELQRRFFALGQNVTAEPVLASAIASVGEDPSALLALAGSELVRVRTQRGFERAHSHGTRAMPLVLLDDGAARRLLVGGYVDAGTLVATIEAALRKSSPPPA